MNRPRTVQRPRPATQPRTRPRTRTEAAAQLVRLEYERDRLTRDLDMLAQRRTTSESALKRVDERLRLLREMLAEDAARNRG
jgi:hypothetical protein